MRINLVCAGVVASLGGFLQSYITCVIAGALLFIVEEFQLDAMQEGWAASTILLGALVGSTSSGILADKLGRRVSLQLSALLFLFSGVAVFFVHSFSMLLLLRLATGFAAGMTSILVPLYLGEIAPAAQRGAFVASFVLAVTVGTLAAYLVGYALAAEGNWRLMFGVSAIPAALQFLVFFFFPNRRPAQAAPIHRGIEELGIGQGGSPDFLARARGIAASQDPKRGRKIWGKADAGQNQLFSHDVYTSKWRDLFLPSVRFVLLLGVGLSVFQQLSGINAVIYFTPKIFKEAGFIEPKEALFPTLFVGVVNMLATLLSMFLIDRIGRKKIFLVSQFGVIATLGLIALGFATKNLYFDYLAVIAVILYVGMYAVGLGPIVWVIIAEIYPLAIRAKAIAALSFLSWLSNYVVVLTFPPFAMRVGASLPFLAYAFLSVCAFFLFLRYLPETKGKTLEELEKMLIKVEREPRRLP